MSLLLDNMLKRLAVWYTHPDVEEIAINRPGEVWLRRRKPAPGEPVWVAEDDVHLTEDYLVRVCHAVANTKDIPFDPHTLPILYATLPGNHRFTAIVGRTVLYERDSEEGVAMTIRQYRPDVGVAFSDFQMQPKGRKTRAAGEPDPTLDEVIKIIRDGGSALLVGATSTGKTTCLNLILREVLPADHRVFVVEDTPELVVPHKNRVSVLLSRTEDSIKIDYAKVVDLAVRMTPDVILCGEVSTRNAGAVLELMETGHRNFLATIHGDSCAGGLRAFMQRYQHINPSADLASTLEILGGGLDVVLHLDRTGSLRGFSEIRRARDLVAEIRKLAA